MHSIPEESRLARAAAEGDGQAFAHLYDRYEKPVYNYCLRLLGNEHDAQDATQEAFLKVMRRLPSIPDRDLRFGSYLYTVARNASYDMIEKRKRTEPVEEIKEGIGSPLGDGPAIEEDPVRSALFATEQDSIRAANARLPERQREVLALREIEGMSYEDIADLLEMNSNSVAQLISRARIRLRDELRGAAAASVVAGTPDCERAMPLLARRQDGKLEDETDGRWLDEHLTSCKTCPIAAEAMAEAGLSYRAWAPVLPAAWLFRDTLAKAAHLVGADWSTVSRPGTEAESDIPALSAPDQAMPNRKFGRGLIVGSSVALILLLGGLASTVFSGEPEKSSPPPPTSTAEKSASPAAEAGSPIPPTKKTAKAINDEKAKPPAKQKAEPPADAAPNVIPPSSTVTTPSPPPSQPAVTTQSADRPKPTRPAPSGQGRPATGAGSWGERTRPDRSKPSDEARVRTDPTPPTPPPTTPPPPAPAPSEPPSRTDPPGGPNDPPDDGGQQPPATKPCLVRVC